MSKSLSIVIVSNKVRYSNTIHKYINANTLLLQYRYDIGYDGLLRILASNIGSNKIRYLAIILYSTPFAVYLCSNDGKVQQFSYEFLLNSHLQMDFFKKLNLLFNLEDQNSCRIDFLSCNMFNVSEITEISSGLQKILSVPCSISKDLWGSDIIVEDNSGNVKVVADIYFSASNLSSFITHQTINGFEKIRIVGKGAYGTAVLYRKKDDDSLVILKEINMHDLSATERQFAMNEVKVLSQLDHPNIVAYFDSFEEDGVLMIEMEYADNGTLSQFLSNQEKPLEEKKILEIFYQILSAIHYIHEHKILHRDLKTVNIFLTKEEIIKIGDFGISKMLSTTHDGANSVIGTPHYISPEMCQGKVYNEKSDVWALGCILHEMACLHKTFEGSNLPALVNKIVKGQFEPLKDNYSDELKELVLSLLQKNPDDRLSTEVILHQKLPMIMKKFHTTKTDEVDLNKRQTRSVAYVMDINSLNLEPVRLPSKIRIKQVCSGENHTIVLTTDRTVFTWGSNDFGQLGHGDLLDRRKPELVSSLTQKSLMRIACGTNFSIFGSENGIIMTCGSGVSGSLGHGDFKDIFKPRLIESLLTVDIVCISAIKSHVVVVSSDGIIYAWGSNNNGQLGLDNLNLFCSPQKINLKETAHIKNAFTTQDATMLLTDNGALLASGSNYGNKLGLNARLGFLMSMKTLSQQPVVSGVHEFTHVRALMHQRVNQVSMGANHTIVMCESGKVISFGLNSSGELGNGNCKNISIPCEVKIMKKLKITKVTCGSHFSIACVNFNSLYIWGRKQLLDSRSVSVTSDEAIKNYTVDKEETVTEKYFQENDNINSPSPFPSQQFPHLLDEFHDETNHRMKVYTTPVLILHLKNPDNDSIDRELICLTNCIPYQDHSLLVQIETTAPPPKRRRRSKTVAGRKKHDSKNNNLYAPPKQANSSINITDLSTNIREVDGKVTETDTIPTWIKNELIEASNDVENSNFYSCGSETEMKCSPRLITFKNNTSKNTLRIYSTGDHTSFNSSKCNSKSSSDSLDTISLPTIKYQDNVMNALKQPLSSLVLKTGRERHLEEQLVNLQEQLKYQQNQLAQSNLVIDNLQKEIHKLKSSSESINNMDRKVVTSSVCIIQ